MRRSILSIVLLFLMAAMGLPAAAQTPSAATSASAPGSLTSKALLFASDGMRPDLM